MLPFETPSIFDQLPRFVFKMPRVVPDQKAKFESDELFRRLSRECEVRHHPFPHAPFTTACGAPFIRLSRNLRFPRLHSRWAVSCDATCAGDYAFHVAAILRSV
ncbi:hypothetical protein HPB48_002214 [Haemaphysalis longicornis]|uniref:Uncharacterized protein n=1 Tax=Haemaphysalis longicornis TaxID=44386 RepID=A0A9J6FJY4_HAELO|nr:hypothetical protein HPB48_002214 [Haemaphysalis longicornis]